MELEASMKHNESLITTSGLDVQTVPHTCPSHYVWSIWACGLRNSLSAQVGKQLAYTLRSETRWKNRPNNKTSAGLSASLVGGSVAVGAKVEDR